MAAVVTTFVGLNTLNPEYKEEVIHCTAVASGDTYTSPNIGTITGVTLSPHFAGIDATGTYVAAWVGNIVTLTLAGTADNRNYSVKIFGTA